MESAEEIAERLINEFCMGKYSLHKCADALAQLLTAYAEERVKENDRWWERCNDQDIQIARSEQVEIGARFQIARSEALEEAALLLEKNDDPDHWGEFHAKEIRELKEKP